MELSDLKPRRLVRGGQHDEKPPLGTYAARRYKRNRPQWWPEDTPVEVVDYVVVRRPKSVDEGLPHEVVVDFKFIRGFEPV